MRVERLSWAGVKLVGSAETLVIDAFGDASPVEQWMGKPTSPLVRTNRLPENTIERVERSIRSLAELPELGSEVAGTFGVAGGRHPQQFTATVLQPGLARLLAQERVGPSSLRVAEKAARHRVRGARP